MKIASVVHNSVRKDARVIKEAVSLDRAGHTVMIYGISDTDKPELFTLPGSSVTVKLAAKAAAARTVKTSLFASPWVRRPIVAAFSMGVLTALAVTAYPLTRQLSIHPDGTLNHAHHLTSQMLLITNVILLALLFRQRLQKHMIRPMIELIRWIVEKTLRLYWHVVVRQFPSSVLAGQFAMRSLNLNFVRILDPLRASLLQDGAPDAVHLHDTVALLLAGDIKQHFGCPIVWDAHEIYEDMAGANDLRGLLNGCVIRHQAEFVDQFITINDSIKTFYAVNHKSLPPATVLMNATDRVVPPAYDGRLHRAAGLPPGQRIVLFQGGFGARRGLHALVEASRDFAPEWTLVLMGWGAMEAELKALASSAPRAGLVPNALFLPGVPHRELQEWSAGASIGAITYENTSLNHLYCTPNKLWEYPSAGVPILATDLEELGRFIRQYQMGFLLPRDFTAKDIAAAVNSATDDALNAARTACQPFMEANNWSVYEPQLQQVYKGLAATRDRQRRPVTARAQVYSGLDRGVSAQT